MDRTYDALHSSADIAVNMLQRVAGDMGVLQQIAAGDWDQYLTSADAVDLDRLIDALTEHARNARAVAGWLSRSSAWGDSGPAPYVASHVAGLASHRLPLNRKERFYTGTVLPMILAHDGFTNLGRFLALCGLDIELAGDHARDGLQDFQFFTEYNFAESRFTPADLRRFPDAPIDGDTPDLVLCGPDWLLVIEAKMFHQPTPAALAEQLERQRVLVDYWAGTLQIDATRVAQVLLLPQAQVSAARGLAPIVTWQQVLDAYRVVGPSYWIGFLQTAIDQYAELVSPSTVFGANADSHLVGATIREGGGRDADGVQYTYMGRRGGLSGQLLAEDIATGRWRQQRYEVRVGELESSNWFPIADFLSRLPDHG